MFEVFISLCRLSLFQLRLESSFSNFVTCENAFFANNNNIRLLKLSNRN